MRRNSDKNQENTSAETEIEVPLSTQEIIEDARERRRLKMNGKEQSFKCDECIFTSTSINCMKKHKENTHNEKDIEMRPRFSCDKCSFKTTSEYVLQKHTNMHHKNTKKNVISKRKTCEKCGKQFNKEDTFMKHMKTVHKTEVN